MLEFLDEATDLEGRAERVVKGVNVEGAVGSGDFTIMSPWKVIGRPAVCRFRRLHQIRASNTKSATTAAPIVPPTIAPRFFDLSTGAVVCAEEFADVIEFVGVVAFIDVVVGVEDVVDVVVFVDVTEELS